MRRGSSEAAVIGAGPSGIAGLRELLKRGIDGQCFETADRVAPRWTQAESGVSTPVYDSLRLNNASVRMRLAGTHMPRHTGPVASAAQFHDYLASVASDQELAARTQLRHGLVSARHIDDKWELRFANGQSHSSRYLILASGLNAAPVFLEALRGFEGQLLHASEYRRPQPFAGRRVLVVGGGNSGAEIACELAGVARSVDLAVSRPFHVVPREVLGFSADLLDGPTISRLPIMIRQAIHDIALLPFARHARRIGLQPPDAPLLRSAWTISSDLVASIADGRVALRPAAIGTRGSRVKFADGSETSYDAAVMAVGYQPRFEALPASPPITKTANGCYLKMVPPDSERLPHVFLLSFCLPLGALLPVAEAQARWTARVIDGSICLPPRPTMDRAIERDTHTDVARFRGSTAPTMLIDPYPYIRRLERQAAG